LYLRTVLNLNNLNFKDSGQCEPADSVSQCEPV
jgi:hypothetical protein